MNNLFEKYDDLSLQVDVAEYNRRKCVCDIVGHLQNRTEDGFISFTDETSYPIFYDETTNERESVVGAKVVNGVLYVTTNTKFEEDELCWFNWERYGSLDLDEFVYILEHSLT